MQIPFAVFIRIRYLFQDNRVRGEEILKMFPKYSHKYILPCCRNIGFCGRQQAKI